MNWKEIEPKTFKLRNDLLATLNLIKEASRTENLLPRSESLHVASDLLANPNYDIVICGEVKKGKSTFINAVIGQEILPTGVKETTSQVFRISNCETESYALVFTDGTSEQITKTELGRYGSQVDADLMGEPMFKNRQLDYIQINTSIEFLPKGVSLVDTPGLGALYKSHELITHRYIQNAAAVVFVFDPSQPMVQQEKVFLEKVFAVTPFVMFVMTKIDCFDESHWITQISRTETLLKDTFGNNCYSTPKVYPISSATLSHAAQEKEADAKEEMVEFSYFPAVYDELIKVTYITVGLSRTQFAWEEANKYRIKVLLSLDEQLKMISASTKEEQEKIREKKNVIRQDFEKLWGPASTKRKEIMQEVQSIIIGVNNRASLLTSTSGNIYRKYNEKIDSLNGLGSIKDFSENSFKEMIGEISTEWQAIATSGQRDVMAALNVIHAEIERVTDNYSFSSSENVQLLNLTSNEKFQSYKTRYYDAAITTTIGGTLLGLAGITLAPFVPFIFLGTLIYGFFGGKSNAEQREIEKNKANLKNHLAKTMNEVNAQIFHTPVEGGHKSILQTFTSELSTSVEKAMISMYERQKNQFETEQKKLDEQAKLGTEQQQKELILINEQRKNWITISGQISEEGKELLFIQNEFGLKDE